MKIHIKSLSKAVSMLFVLVTAFTSLMGLTSTLPVYAESTESGCTLSSGSENDKCDPDKKLDCNTEPGVEISTNNCGIARYLKLFINTLSGLVGLTVIIVLIVGGIQYTTSGGDANAVAKAKKRISNAILALVFFAFMYGFLQWIVPGGVL